MRNDSRLSRTLHVLLHMARHEGPMTSEAIGRMLGTNPVVVRRTMAGLRNAGYVRSEKGHGGGWSIAADLDAVSLLDVHRAVGGPRVFAIGSDRSNPECAVEEGRQRGDRGYVARSRSVADCAARFGQPCPTGARFRCTVSRWEAHDCFRVRVIPLPSIVSGRAPSVRSKTELGGFLPVRFPEADPKGRPSTDSVARQGCDHALTHAEIYQVDVGRDTKL